MAITIWAVASTVFLPLGIFLLSLLLSGFQTLERLAQILCNYRIAFSSRAKVSIPIFITMILSIAFVSEWGSLAHLGRQRETHDALHPLEFNAQFRAQQWRHQRNWWIAFFNMLLWLVIARASELMRYFREKIGALEKDKIEVLKRVAGNQTELRETRESLLRKRKTNEVELAAF